MVVDESTSFSGYEPALRGSSYRLLQTDSPRKALEMTSHRAPELLLTAMDFLDYYRTQIDGPELIRRMHARRQDMKFVLPHDRPESEVQPVLDELTGEGIVDVRHMRFEDAPNNLGGLVQSLTE